MAALEDELIAQIRNMDEAKKRRVLDFVQELNRSSDLTTWFEEVEQLQTEMRKHSTGQALSVQDMLDEVREEGSWPRW